MSCDTLPAGLNTYETTIEMDGCACAVVGCEEGRLIYDYDLLLQHFADCEGMRDDDDEDMGRYDMAAEWIDYNVIRGLPYAGPGITPDIRDDGVSIIDYDEEE